jgi:hypothetical protein
MPAHLVDCESCRAAPVVAGDEVDAARHIVGQYDLD